MYEIVKAVIKSRRFELKEMLRKIDVLWTQDELSDEQKFELQNMAREYADMSKGYASLEERVAALEAFRAQIEASGELPKVEENIDEYPPWKQPTHNENAYKTGAKMTYTDGKKYECIAPEGYGVTYGPDVLPNMWELKEG